MSDVAAIDRSCWSDADVEQGEQVAAVGIDAAMDHAGWYVDRLAGAGCAGRPIKVFHRQGAFENADDFVAAAMKMKARVVSGRARETTVAC